MNIPVTDNGKPVQPGDSYFKYKGVYHPVVWVGDTPYRPRVETLVLMNGNAVYARIKDEDRRGSSGNGECYELPGGSIDADCEPIRQAENEVNEEALIAVKNIYDTGIQYYADYPSGFIMSGGDTPLEYAGHISTVYVAEYDGIYDRDKVEKKDLDPKISENGKFYPITKMVPLFRQEHINALLNSPYVSDAVKGAIRIINRKSNPTPKKNPVASDKIVGELFFVSRLGNLEYMKGSTFKNGRLHIDTEGKSVIRVFSSVEDAINGYDSVLDKLTSGTSVYVYTIKNKADKIICPTTQQSPSSKITSEMWIPAEEPVDVKRVGLICITDTGKSGKYYYGKNSLLVGTLPKFRYTWTIKDRVTNVMESNVLVKDNKIYHGSTYLIDKFVPMSLDLGNATQEPGWSTFAFADYTLALRFGLMRAIQKVKEYYKDRCKDVVCSWSSVDKKPFISSDQYKFMKPLILNFKYYVYTIDSTDLDLGIGNDENFPEITFRESGVVPESTDVIKIDEPLLKEHLLILPGDMTIEEYTSSQEKMMNRTHNRGWYAIMMTKDYNNGLASAQLQKAVRDGYLKPGDDISTYMSKSGIAFDDDSISIKSYVSEACKNVDEARKFVSEVGKLAKKYDANYFVVTDGASGISNKGNAAVKHARDCHIDWEKKHGYDPYEDWSKSVMESKEGVSEAASRSSISRNDILDKIKQFHLRLSGFDYFIIQENGKIDYTTSKYMAHRTLTPSQFEKYKGGICWDYVPYQVDYFKKHFKNVKTKSFFHVFINDKDQPTHTFMLFYLNHKVYYFECSWKSMMGIYEFSSETDALSYIISELYKDLSPDQRDYVYDKYTLEYNPLDSSLFGLSCIEYMDYMGDKINKKQGIYRYDENKSSHPVVIQRTTIHVENNKPIVSVTEAAEYSSVNKYPVFIILMHTGTPLSTTIKTVTRDEFSHAAVSFNSKLDQLYSFGTKKYGHHEHGLVQHNTKDDFYRHYHATYSVFVMYVSKEQRDKMLTRLRYFIENEANIKFDIASLIACAMQIPTEFRKKFFCSRFVMEIIGQGIELSKYPSMWTPQQISELDNITMVNKGDDLYMYDYRITEKNLKKIRDGKLDDIVMESVRSELPDSEFGLPDKRKYPLHDPAHVQSAIKFFNYVSEEDEKELAKNILKKIDEYDMKGEMSVTKKNRFFKYAKSSGIMEAIDIQSDTDKDCMNQLVMGLPANVRTKVIEKLSRYNPSNIIYEDCLYVNGCIASALTVYKDSADKSVAHMIVVENEKSKSSDMESMINDVISGISLMYEDIEILCVLSLPAHMDAPCIMDIQREKANIVYEGYLPIPVMENNEYYKNIPLKTYNKIKKIHNSLSNDEKYYVGGTSVSKYTVYVDVRNEAYIILDDYNGKYTDKHPYQGKIISIAASSRSRGTGDTDRLIKDAIRNNRDSVLIAEIDKGNYHSENLFKRNGFRLIDSKDDILFYGYSNNNRKVMESWVPLMEAPNEDDDTATDYTEDVADDDGGGEETATDYTEDADTGEDGDITDDTGTEEENPDDTTTEEEGDQGGDTGEDELQATDYTDGTDTGEDTPGDAEGTATDGGTPRNGNLIDNNVLKNYSVLRNFEKLYNLTKEVSDSLDSVVMPSKLQNTVLAQVLKNLNSIKEFILSYVKFQFSSDNYAQNLYYYNLVLQTLNLNLELLKSNKELEDTKLSKKNSRR